MSEIDCIVWDFDGVLNTGIGNGEFLWTRTFEADTGQSLNGFREAVFSGVFRDVLRGRVDLLDPVSEWADRVGYAAGGEALLDYWFAKDANPDARMVGIMERASASGRRQVIATNNEARRTDYIEHEMGFGARVEAIFCSGRLGCAKPEPAFFDMVSAALGIAPERLLFVDDHAPNVDAAAALGWQTLHFADFDYATLETRLGL